jgi:hypothetical protein
MPLFPLSNQRVLTNDTPASTDSARAGLRLSATAVITEFTADVNGVTNSFCNGVGFVGDEVRMYVVGSLDGDGNPIPMPPRRYYHGGLPYTDAGALVGTLSVVANYVNGVPMSDSGLVCVT